MAPARGTDPETERRKLRPRERPPGFWRLVDDLSTGWAEVLFLSVPGLAVVVRTRYEPAAVTFAALVAVVVLGAGAGIAGGRWVEPRPAWPAWRVSTAVFRLGHYSLSVVVLAFGGGTLDATYHSSLLTVGAIAVGGVLAVAALPLSLWLTRWAVGGLVGWHRYLFGPTPPPES